MTTVEKLRISWVKIGELIDEIAQQAQELGVNRIVGISRGGLPLAVALSHRLNLPLSVVGVSSYNINNEQETLVCDTPDVIFEGWEGNVLICDDIADSGKTLLFLLSKMRNLPNCNAGSYTATLYYKEHSLIKPDLFIETTDKWVVFPWEWE